MMVNKRNLVWVTLGLFILCIVSCRLYGQSSHKFGKRLSKQDKDAIQNSLIASFYYYPTVIVAGQIITFYDLSTGRPETWCWNFGDGQLSYERNPRHKYKAANLYFITLQVERDGETSNRRVAVLVKSATNGTLEDLKADFIFEPGEPQIGIPVRFYDISTGNPSKWTWQFGYFDFSFLRQPVKTFFYEGNYKITLTVKNGSRSSRVAKYLKVGSKQANVITAKSCSYNDVLAAIATAKAGDAVVVPNGTASWSQALIITKGIILKAATVGGVIIKSGAAAGSSYGDPANFLVAYVPSSDQVDKPFRLSGFVLDGNNNRFTFMADNEYLTPITQFRLDHCLIKNSPGSLLHFFGEIYGVIDNNELRGDTCPSFVTRDFSLNEKTWSNITFDFGSVNNRYYEDNIIYLGSYGSSNEGGLGGRYCVRYNTFYNAGGSGVQPWFDMHGNGGAGGNHGTMGAEIYANTIYCNNKSLMMFDQRGGKLMAFNNSAVNANSGAPGKVREEVFDSDNPPATNPAGQPQHVSDSYYWNQSINGSISYDFSIPQTLDYGGNTGIVPRWDVHCFKQVQKFDGSSGVGVGPLAQRPSYCTTEGVAWWATDENKLYRWHNMAWELYYVPYTYPHPLRTALND